jgi:uncharacterized membrane protein YgcG
MRRLIYVLLLAVFVSVSVSCVSASTDCERWLAGYRQQLAHSHQLQRLAAARNRARLRLAGWMRHTPTAHPAVARHPRMTRKQTLHHFDVACGVLPEAEDTASNLAGEAPAELHAAAPSGDGMGMMPADMGNLMAQNEAPPEPFDPGTAESRSDGGPSMGGSSGGGGGGGGGYAPAYNTSPNGGYSSGTPSGAGGTSSGAGGTSPGVGGTPSGAGPGTDSAPPSGGITQLSDAPPVPPPPAVVPEPASFVLLLTGLAGAAGSLRRRMRA